MRNTQVLKVEDGRLEILLVWWQDARPVILKVRWNG